MLRTEGRHDAIQEFRDAFEFDHLPDGLPRVVAASYHDFAAQLLALLPDGPALKRAIHDLWRSKNEAVRFAVRIGAEGTRGARSITFKDSPPAHAVEPVQRVDHPAPNPFRPRGPEDGHPHEHGTDDEPAERPRSGLSFVGDDGAPVPASHFLPSQRPGPDAPQD